MTEACAFCGLVSEAVCQTAEAAKDCFNVPEIPDGPFRGLKWNHYKAILADPPWTFETRSDEGKDRSPEKHYACMSIDDIKALPVNDLAAKDCVLFLWVIDTHIAMALEVIEAWGFAYKTKAFTWVKTNQGASELSAEDPAAYFTGMGFWTRANPEDALLATRGKPKRRETGGGVRRLIVAARREHSRKPDDIFARIEELVHGPYLELFSREYRPGWTTWGNEQGKFSPPADDDIESMI